jgi:hypothetical protein
LAWVAIRRRCSAFGGGNSRGAADGEGRVRDEFSCRHFYSGQCRPQTLMPRIGSGFRLFQQPAVKSGKSTGRLWFRADCSESSMVA